jgi:hypothetical protein
VSVVPALRVSAALPPTLTTLDEPHEMEPLVELVT